MDATRFYKLAGLLPIGMVFVLTITPTLEAQESSDVVIAESTQGDIAKTKSVAGTLVLVPSEPKPVARRPAKARSKGHPWKHDSVKDRGNQSASTKSEKIQLVAHEESIAPVRKPRRKATVRTTRQRVAKVKSSDSTAQMLVRAHELSQQAKSEADYEDIAVICDTAERLGLGGEQLEFAVQLHAWATKHRDQLRIERIQQQLRAEKSAQQLRAKQSEQKLKVQRARQQLLAEQAAEELRVRKMEQQLRAEKINEELRSKKLQQQLRAEKAEEELKSVEIQKQLQAELAEQQLRAQRAEQQLRAMQSDLDQANKRLKERTNKLAEERPDGDLQDLAAKKTKNRIQGWQEIHDRGVTLAEQGKNEAALVDFNRVIKINPMFPKAYANRGTLFAQAGNLEQAHLDYQQACALDPELLAAQLGLGRVYHLMGLKEEALACFSRAIELNPDGADIFCSRADLLSDMGLYRDALADYAQAIDLNPEFAHAYRNGAWLLATCPNPRFRDPANAVRGAQRALDFNYGERHVTLDTLAAAHASAGDFDQAIEDLQEAIEIAPLESQTVYRARLQQYQDREPFLTEPVEDISQVVYEVSDR